MSAASALPRSYGPCASIAMILVRACALLRVRLRAYWCAVKKILGPGAREVPGIDQQGRRRGDGDSPVHGRAPRRKEAPGGLEITDEWLREGQVAQMRSFHATLRLAADADF
jgi:hypothetical protein